MDCLYERLGVARDASDDDLRTAWRALAARLHPDRDPDGAEAFARVSEAWRILSDPDRRLVYDRTGLTALGQEQAAELAATLRVRPPAPRRLSSRLRRPRTGRTWWGRSSLDRLG